MRISSFALVFLIIGLIKTSRLYKHGLYTDAKDSLLKTIITAIVLELLTLQGFDFIAFAVTMPTLTLTMLNVLENVSKVLLNNDII